jgi:hypothetical protein
MYFHPVVTLCGSFLMWYMELCDRSSADVDCESSTAEIQVAQVRADQCGISNAPYLRDHFTRPRFADLFGLSNMLPSWFRVQQTSLGHSAFIPKFIHLQCAHLTTTSIFSTPYMKFAVH